MAEIVDDAGTIVYIPQTRTVVDKKSGQTRKIPKSASVPTYTPPAPPSGTGGGGGSTPSGPSPAERAAAAARSAAAAAANKARQQANKAATNASRRDIRQFSSQLDDTQRQINVNRRQMRALKGLVQGDLKGARDTLLQGVSRSLQTKMGQIKQTYKSSLGDFQEALSSNDASESDSSFSNLINMTRERGDAVAQALSQGAGESDVLRSQLGALRNFSANQSEINRSYYDTRSSVESGLTDLANATRTSRINEELQANADRGAIFDDYYGSMADTFSQLANIDSQQYLLRGERGTLQSRIGAERSLIDWVAGGRDAADFVSPDIERQRTKEYTSDYARRAADFTGRVWDDPGVSQGTRDWKGWEAQATSLGSSRRPENQGVAAAPSIRKRPEGATLRTW
jgi:hypothetical protein